MKGSLKHLMKDKVTELYMQFAKLCKKERMIDDRWLDDIY